MEPRKVLTRNPVKLLQRKAAYIEKHRIYELFQELSMMLLIKKPKDHVLFLKQSIYHAARRLDVPRLIIIPSPGFDSSELVGNLKKSFNIPAIALEEVICGDEFISQRKFVEHLKDVVMMYMKYGFDGWIFYDFPRSEEEAKFLQRSGFIPSHVFEITTSDTMSETSVSTNGSSEVRRFKEMKGIRNVFAEVLTKVNAENLTMDEVTEKIVKLVKYRKYSRSPSHLHVLYIDFNANRCKCVAKHVAEEFDLIHIDFKKLLKQVSQRDSEFSYDVRDAIALRTWHGIPADMKIRVFEEFLLKSETAKKGWILTGLVFTVDDFKKLDMTDFPPNRIIIVGSEEDKPCSDTCSSSAHSDLSCHCEGQIDDITSYVGESAHVIEGSDDAEKLERQVDFWLMQPAPCVPPRQPRPPSPIKPEDVEFDPDDEPDSEVFDCIREPEPDLVLV